MKKQILLAILALFLVVSACNAVSAASVNNSTTQLVVNNSLPVSSGSSASVVRKSAVKSVSALSAVDDVYVSKAGDDQSGDGSKAHPYATISKALTIVSSGGNIHILKGTYNEYGLTLDKNVNILGESQFNTIIDAKGKGNIFTINQGVNVLIQNLTLTNGAKQGSGSAIYNEGNMTVSGCTFTNNTASSSGGAIYNDWIMAVSGCTFTNNTAYDGGAIFNSWDMTVSGCTFTDNTATNSGGAIHNRITYGGSVILILNDCAFIGNNATLYGGAIFNGGTITAHFNRFVNNTAPQGNSIDTMQGPVDAKYNWWGSNKDPSGECSGDVNYGPWLVLTIKSSSDKTDVGGKVNVAADLQHDNNGVYHDPSEGHVIDGTVVSFSVDNGSLNPITVELVNGSAFTVFTAKNVGSANVSATLDKETVTTKLTVSQSKTSLTVVNVTAVAGKVVSVTAVLRDENGNALAGKTVTFNINGVTFTAVTDASGVAVFKYTPTKEGVYPVNASFAGDDNYLSCAASGVLIVNSSKPVKPVKPDSGSGDSHSGISGDNNKVHAADVIGLQKTGLPLNYLILAIFAVFSGLIMPRRKN